MKSNILDDKPVCLKNKLLICLDLVYDFTLHNLLAKKYFKKHVSFFDPIDKHLLLHVGHVINLNNYFSQQ